MPNIKSAADYHHMTAYHRDRMAPHHLDWKNQPRLHKTYTHTESIPLPDNLDIPSQDLFELFRQPAESDGSEGADIEKLALILKLTLCVTAESKYKGGTFYYRSAASAGALYPTEIYTAVTDLKGLEDGIYHFDILNQTLTPVRKGDFSRYIAENLIPSQTQPARITIFFTTIFFRSSWKYRDRSYRYHLLDTGHIIENMTLAMKSMNVPFKLSYDFDDRKINCLLGTDDFKEAALAIIHIPEKNFIPSNKDLHIRDLSNDVKKASYVSKDETDYLIIQEIHKAGMEIKPDAGLQEHINNKLGTSHKKWNKIQPQASQPGTIKYPEALFRRRSSRNFINNTMNRDSLLLLIDILCETDFMLQAKNSSTNSAISTGFIAGNVENTTPGLYMINTEEKSISPSFTGSLNENMAGICLDQAWLKNAVIHFLFITNLDLINKTWGARGYRYAMLHAGQMGERLYIAATSMGMGCCGIGAYYDREAADILRLNSHSALLYLVAVGPVKS